MECPCCISKTRRQLLGMMAVTAGGLLVSRLAPASTGSIGKGTDTSMKSVDIHAHYYPEEFLHLLGSEGKAFGGSYTRQKKAFSFATPAGSLGPLPLKFIDIQARLKDMDSSGVDIQALSLSVPMVYWADRQLNARMARVWNDAASAVHRQHPQRFVVLATLPMLDAHDSITELERVADLPGVRGIYMGTNINGLDLDDPRFAQIFARIEQLGLPVFLHPQQTVGGARLSEYYLSNLLGNPFDTAIAASHLILGGVLDRHPQLHFSLPHAGGALPILVGRLDAGWTSRPETRRLAQKPSSYLTRFSYDTVSHSVPVLDFLIANVGIDHLVLGSDYCFDMGYEQPVRFIENAGLGIREKAAVIGGNAARILRLPG
ncbi:amidohydrolase family protein [Pseudomonas sp. R81]|uniref:amidohydrolase family protein n=1 Tax=Pseudomonas sp. R81 TaxID=1144885 RepID=UPI0002FCD3C6|nr:amidohydrolase family protein [Pseudomonas sp. R81]